MNPPPRTAFVQVWKPSIDLSGCLSCTGWTVTTTAECLTLHSHSRPFTLVAMERHPYVPLSTINALGSASSTSPIPISHIQSNALSLSHLSSSSRTQVIAHDLVQYRYISVVKQHGHIAEIVRYTTDSVICKYIYTSAPAKTPPCCHHYCLLRVPFESFQFGLLERLTFSISRQVWSCFGRDTADMVRRSCFYS
jgi:hypothetical protein